MNCPTVKVGPHTLPAEANEVFETWAEVALAFSRTAELGVPG